MGQVRVHAGAFEGHVGPGVSKPVALALPRWNVLSRDAQTARSLEDGALSITSGGGSTDLPMHPASKTSQPKTAFGRRLTGVATAGYGKPRGVATDTGHSKSTQRGKWERTDTASRFTTERFRQAWWSCTHAMNRCASIQTTYHSGLSRTTHAMHPSKAGACLDREIIKPSSRRIRFANCAPRMRLVESAKRRSPAVMGSAMPSCHLSSLGRRGSTSSEARL